MNRNVDITVTGIHSRPGDPTEKVETLSTGVYELLEDGRQIIEYDEEQIKGELIVHNRIELSPGDEGMMITRSGGADSVLSFKRDGVYDTDYSTPYGMMKMRVRTSEFDLSKSADESMKIVAGYSLEMEGQLLSDSMIVIEIKNAET